MITRPQLPPECAALHAAGRGLRPASTGARRAPRRTSPLQGCVPYEPPRPSGHCQPPSSQSAPLRSGRRRR